MLYFCNRPLAQSPFEIDYTAIRLIQEFKEEMQNKCLYQDFIETSDFEKNLYYHLDIKTDELLRGLLPLPGHVPESETEQIFWDRDAPDERLRQPQDFGSSVEEIASQFIARMDEFDRVGHGQIVLTRRVISLRVSSFSRRSGVSPRCSIYQCLPGFLVEVAGKDIDSNEKPGTVVNQEPWAGSSYPAGTTISVLIAEKDPNADFWEEQRRIHQDYEKRGFFQDFNRKRR